MFIATYEFRLKTGSKFVFLKVFAVGNRICLLKLMPLEAVLTLFNWQYRLRIKKMFQF